MKTSAAYRNNMLFFQNGQTKLDDSPFIRVPDLADLLSHSLTRNARFQNLQNSTFISTYASPALYVIQPRKKNLTFNSFPMSTFRCVHSQIALAFHAFAASHLFLCFYLLRVSPRSPIHDGRVIERISVQISPFRHTLGRQDASDGRQRGCSVKPLALCGALKSCFADGMDNIQTSSVEVKSEWSHISTSPHMPSWRR